MVANPPINKKRVEDLLYPELSYTLFGILFEIHNKLGTNYQEKHYQKAFEIKLKKLQIPYQKEAKVDVEFDKEKLGKFFIDFIIDNKIILEFKKVWKISNNDIKQVLRYLDATNLKLAIIVNFKYKKLEYRRVVKSH